jgi:hypothetical protein
MLIWTPKIHIQNSDFNDVKTDSADIDLNADSDAD